jgi:membrane-associated phospholipid phosphatase
MDAEDRLKLAVIAAIFVIDVVGFFALGLHFDWSSAIVLATVWPVIMALGWFYQVKRPEPAISRLLWEVAHLVLFSALAAILSYLAIGLNQPLADEFFVAMDAMIGFDWMAYVGFVNERPWLGDLSTALYVSTLIQVALAAIVLPLVGRIDRARELVMAVFISALVAIAISAVYPTSGALAYFRPDEAFYLVNQPVVDLAYKEEFYRMRALEIPQLSLQGAKGLIAFPSYHASLSILIALMFRGMPWLFWPLLGLNVAVIFTTPIDGGHHLIDGIGGAVVGLASLWVTVRLRRAIHHREPIFVPAIGTAQVK